MVKRILNIRELSSVFFMVFLFGLVGLINSDFLSARSLLNCFNDSTVFTLLAAGIGVVILTGEIDVSIGSTLGLAAAITGSLLRDGAAWIMAIAFGILAGLIVGLVNGIGIAYLKVPSLIFTLGTNGLVRGLIYVYTNGAWVENLPPEFTKMSHLMIWNNLTVFYFITIIIVLIFHLILTRTKKGKYFVAVGDNFNGAEFVGIPGKKIKFLAYIICSVFAALAGVVYASRIGFVTPTAGSGYEMKAIAACVLGGISLTGGLGSLLGASIGAVIMSSISRILVFLGFSSDYDNTITGLMLISIVVIDSLIQRKKQENTDRKRLQAKIIDLDQACTTKEVKGA